MGEKNKPLFELGTCRLGFAVVRVDAPSLSSETSPAGAAVYTVDRFFLFPRRSRFDSAEFAMAARRTERFTDHATMPRQARTANPMNPSMAPTAMKTVPSGVLDVCMYGAFAIGGTVTMGPLVVVEAENVVVGADDVVVVLSVVEEVVEVVEEVVEVSDEVVVVESMLVVVVELEDVVVLVVLSEVDVDVEEVVDSVVDSVGDGEVSVTLGMISVVERSAVGWAAVSFVVSPLGSADTRATLVRTSKKRSRTGEWAPQSPLRRSRMVSARKQSNRLVSPQRV